MPEYRNVTRRPQDLADGRILAAGEHTPPDFDPSVDETGHDARLVDDGLLVLAVHDDPKAPEPGPYDGIPHDDLLGRTEARDLEVEGSGASGYVTRDDLVEALVADDADNPANPEDQTA